MLLDWIPVWRWQLRSQRKKKENGSISKTRTLHMHHRFYSILCCQGTTTKSKFLILRFTWKQDNDSRFQFLNPLRTVLKNTPQHLTNQTRWNNSDEVWNSANSLLRWRFLCRRRRRHGYLSSLKSAFDWNCYFYIFLFFGSACSNWPLQKYHNIP